MERVGIRELKQNASAVIERVRQGEPLEVTEHGRPVAVIMPLPQGSVSDRLVAEGRARAAEGNLADLPAPPPPRAGTRLPSEVLAELRADER